MRFEDTIVETTIYNHHNTLDERLREQAEVSFKAAWKYALEGAVMEGAYDSIEKVGIRKVVEWIGKNCPEANQYWHSLLLPKLLLDMEEWKRQLKEWGISGE